MQNADARASPIASLSRGREREAAELVEVVACFLNSFVSRDCDREIDYYRAYRSRGEK